MIAAILEKIGAPLAVRDIELPDKIEKGQVLVRVLCTGICGSQLQEMDGIKGNPDHIPHLLGHEGCGIVEKIGEGVEGVTLGDKAVMHWRKGYGLEAHPAVYGRNGQSIKAGPITTFSEFAVVSENRVTKIPDDVPNDLAALLGCALSTALSIIRKDAKLRPHESVVVIGCGGLGLAIILACKISGLRSVWGIDKELSKHKLVCRLGSGFSTPDTEMVCDVVIDTVGDPDARKRGDRYISLQPGGTSAGGFDPTFDIPEYVNLWRSGALKDYEKIITHRISLDEINDGIQLMRDGKAGRVMIEMS
jgi:S-(hydroxymethyl)glutathione dehydrogenase / alcohol dehydrogenase